MISKAVVADLLRLAGPAAVSADEQDLVAAGTDFVGLRGRPGVVVRPIAAEAVAAVLGYAGARGIPVFPRAAGTNLCGGFAPTPDGIALDLSRMTAIEDVDEDARLARVQPGVINADLQARLAPMRLRFSPDPASAAISSIGGNIAENAGGPGCIKHGVTFHHVAAAQVALSDGRLLDLRDDGPVDLLGVVIGSEGILGVVTGATLRLRPEAAARWTALVAFGTVEAAAETASAVIAEGLLPSKLEFCDQRQVELCEAYLPSGYPMAAAAVLFVEIEGTEAEVAGDVPRLAAVLRRSDPQLRVASTAAERERLWAGRLAAGHSYRHTGKHFYICDVTVPRQELPRMIARARELCAGLRLDLATVAHAGDGNVHPVILYPVAEVDRMRAGADAIAAAAVELGGTLTGEHGIGSEKVGQMRRRFGPTEVAAFRAIKAAFDPADVLNPGILLPPPAADEPVLPIFTDRVAAALSGGPTVGDVGDEVAAAVAVTVDLENLTVEAGGGALCADVAAEVRRAGMRCVALETVGTVADALERAAAPEDPGNRVAARAALLALRVRLPDGPMASFGSAAVKDVAGLDAKRLVAGAGGRFGRVESAILRMVPGTGWSRSASRPGPAPKK